ncbi:MAG TPA: hypothetical protein VK644_11190 [Chitinophagaceae bacterium]|nr:hypothetical protein [Chitinophagaceae bacterium]
MKSYLLLLVLLANTVGYGQYYYSDLVDAHNLGERMKTYSANKVQSVTAAGFDAQGSKTTDFNEWQEVNSSGNWMKITTRNGQSISRQLYQFDARSRLSAITDSGGTIRSVTSYVYDGNNNIVSVNTVVRDSLNDFSEREEHQWQYNGTGKPQKMWRIVNGKDSSEYRFTTDEKGNVLDEQLFRRGVGLDNDKINYYYDDNNRLTDIVRYDKKLKRLLPDQMFEYDEANRIIQRTTMLSTVARSYLIWRYIFNEKGLKTKEALFDKQKQLTGKIEYSYVFAP